MKRKCIILFTVICVIVLFISFFVIIAEINPSFADPHGDKWFYDEIRPIVMDYVRQMDNVEGKVKVTKWSFTDYNYDIVLENRTREEKVFPFKRLEVIAETADHEYTVYFLVDSDGILQIEKCEKKNNFNPLLKDWW